MSDTLSGMAFRFLTAVVLLAAALPAWSWSPLGHRLVGELAQRQLHPDAAREVNRLLAGEAEPSLAGVANWADTLRQSDAEQFKRTARWHYVNTPPGAACAYVPERDCPNGDCVIGAIQSQLAILADRRQPLPARRDALKFVVHFIGDAHQPMHNNHHDDAGGNRYQISLRTALEPEAYARDKYVDGVMGTNLHAVWDYYVLGESGLDTRSYAERFSKTGLVPLATPLADPVTWSRESCLLVDAWGVYPQGHKLDARYAEAMRPLAERRVLQAGFRLADALNAALAPAAPKDTSLAPAP